MVAHGYTRYVGSAFTLFFVGAVDLDHGKCHDLQRFVSLSRGWSRRII